MWLIDASTINVGGAVGVLTLVVSELEAQGIDYLVIKDKRLDDGILDDAKCYTQNNPILGRRTTYRKLLSEYPIDRVVSLMNFPPPYKLSIPVHTFFHNVNLLRDANLSNSGIGYRLSLLMKNQYIRLSMKYTDYYTFQSSLIVSKFTQDFGYPIEQCNVYPFYNEAVINLVKSKNYDKVKNTFIYVSTDYPHKNHLRLLDCWKSLLDLGHTPSLTLTVPITNIQICNRINELNALGCQITNLGVVDYAICLEYTAKSEFCIFPSLSESLGLGLVEGQMLGCKVLVSDMDYAYQAIEPSDVFDPYKTESIVASVLKAMTQSTPDTQLRMKNRLGDWIDFVKRTKS